MRQGFMLQHQDESLTLPPEPRDLAWRVRVAKAELRLPAMSHKPRDAQPQALKVAGRLRQGFCRKGVSEENGAQQRTGVVGAGL